ncbi:MAG: hypothetical protein SOY12_05175 [Schaedlerella sp.]|nr:hypothetical protein [Lachnospiraceae bacterium]MDY4202427.1 hypothetical protein [Schaedlerella sp.]
MKKTTRVLALIGAILLFLMYGCTLTFALIGTETANKMLNASIAATILVPVLIYGYILLYRVLNKNNDESSSK